MICCDTQNTARRSKDGVSEFVVLEKTSKVKIIIECSIRYKQI